jgi:hypothetical protein
MTTRERFERIEHISAGMAEERRKDREEHKAVWRDTQRQLNEVSTRLVQFSEADSRLEARLEQLAEDSRTAITRLADESRAANKQLEEHIASLISGFGEFIRQIPRQQKQQARVRRIGKKPRGRYGLGDVATLMVRSEACAGLRKIEVCRFGLGMVGIFAAGGSTVRHKTNGGGIVVPPPRK